MLMEYIQRWQVVLQTAMFSSLFWKQEVRELLQWEKKEKCHVRLEVKDALCFEEAQPTDENRVFFCLKGKKHFLK